MTCAGCAFLGHWSVLFRHPLPPLFHSRATYPDSAVGIDFWPTVQQSSVPSAVYGRYKASISGSEAWVSQAKLIAVPLSGVLYVHTVNVVFRIIRKVKIKTWVTLGICSPRAAVSSDQNGQFPCWKLFNRASRFSGVHRRKAAALMPFPSENPNLVSSAFCIHENDGAVGIHALQQTNEKRDFLFIGGHVAGLFDVVGRLSYRLRW